LAERFQRSKAFLTNEVAVPLINHIFDESSVLLLTSLALHNASHLLHADPSMADAHGRAAMVGEVEAVVRRWKVMAQNVDELYAWNDRQGGLLDAEVDKAKARFGYGV